MKAGVYVWSLPMHKSGILPEVMNNMKKRKDWWMSRESYLWISIDFLSREIIMINATIKDGKNYRAIRDASGKMQFSWYRTTAFPLVCIYWVDRRKRKKGCLLA